MSYCPECERSEKENQELKEKLDKAIEVINLCRDKIKHHEGCTYRKAQDAVREFLKGVRK